MIKKLLDRYCKKHELVLVTLKEQSNLGRYRAARGELKKSIDDYNKLLAMFVENTTTKQLKEILREKNIEEIPTDKAELQLKVTQLLQKEFK